MALIGEVLTLSVIHFKKETAKVLAAKDTIISPTESSFNNSTPELSTTPSPLPTNDIAKIIGQIEESQKQASPLPLIVNTPSPSPSPKIKLISIIKTPSPTPKFTLNPSPQATASAGPTISPSPISTLSPKPSNTAIPRSTFTQQQIYEFTDRFGAQYGVDPNVLRHIALCESGFNPLAIHLSYYGLYQFGPTTWQNIRKKMGEDINTDLRLNAEEAVQTAAYQISIGGTGIWPNCKP